MIMWWIIWRETQGNGRPDKGIRCRLGRMKVKQEKTTRRSSPKWSWVGSNYTRLLSLVCIAIWESWRDLVISKILILRPGVKGRAWDDEFLRCFLPQHLGGNSTQKLESETLIIVGREENPPQWCIAIFRPIWNVTSSMKYVLVS